MNPFSLTWQALRSTVADLADRDFASPSGCRGWLVRDLVCHLIIDAQDVLITLSTPTADEATHDAITYWTVSTTPPTGEDPLDALTIRLAAAYQQPELLKFHLEDIGAAAGRAAGLVDPMMRVSTQGQVLTAGDYLSGYVLEWTLHHLDLITHLPRAAHPPVEGLRQSRRMLETIVGTALPDAFGDEDALLIGTGRRAPTAIERDAMGELAAAKFPVVLS
ncbi:maleylpyruvate isomerase N-terminal domain-containing protein [Mycolicibacterium brumae]|uniref:maleylpyruvate isomerase N-terminal domain-containing protein n=1 Tax=Mycolicibacterium brumae TaxID=85968 RepID=UPI000B80B728|nr:maleylpyruvate isomerase N-terminal domain-containing protein [Mycolicibacterium brumae]MCV7192780.1 maleylpyruvate isomerase N-terminal domain-containing protein [Mycolicibacterium brumae]UWW08700.1 maleylpyruvate isomerase N-terminal domain-containing protein [Mycolicibacterium brumae]